MIETIKTVMVRDLQAVGKEISAFESEEKLWNVKGGVTNSAGNLCLHLIGNLNHFVGAGIGKTGFVRQRDEEFSSRDVPRMDLLKMLDETAAMLSRVFDQMKPEQLQAENPFPKSGGTQMVKNYFLLLHLIAHLNYHLGQINYLRRML
jgi:uncharacterized damage-inducible protein DinB